jgi:prepilin-type processing-associated H-X9-DG protein
VTLIVEDGTAKADAESYQTVAGADTYHANRGNVAWADLSTPTKEQNLRKATDYMLQAYRIRWAGVRTTSTQALDWPRYNVPMTDGPGGLACLSSYYPNNTVPAAVANACAELALKASAADLTPDLSQAVKSKKVGQIEVVYQDYSSATKTYRAIDNLLAPLLAAQGGIRVVRG